MKKIFFILISTTLLTLAYINVAAATGWSGYQPELPDALR